MEWQRNYAIKACRKCSKGKSRHTHTYGTYKIYQNNNNLKVVCKTCGYTEYFRFIEGGFTDKQEFIKTIKKNKKISNNEK